MQRRPSTAITAFQKRRIGIEKLLNALEFTHLRGPMDGLIFARRHRSYALASFFKQSRNTLMPAIPRHLDQATIVVSVPLGVGAGLEKHLHRFQAPGANLEMHRLRTNTAPDSNLDRAEAKAAASLYHPFRQP
jgi:hypothetical protein